MYSKFDLKISSFLYNSELNKHLEVGKKIYNNHREQAKKNLKNSFMIMDTLTEQA